KTICCASPSAPSRGPSCPSTAPMPPPSAGDAGIGPGVILGAARGGFKARRPFGAPRRRMTLQRAWRPADNGRGRPPTADPNPPMCGRFLLLSSGDEIARLFGLSAAPEVTPRYNIAPTQPVQAVRAAGTGRECVGLRWGFIPSWSKDGKL